MDISTIMREPGRYLIIHLCRTASSFRPFQESRACASRQYTSEVLGDFSGMRGETEVGGPGPGETGPRAYSIYVVFEAPHCSLIISIATLHVNLTPALLVVFKLSRLSDSAFLTQQLWGITLTLSWKLRAPHPYVCAVGGAERGCGSLQTPNPQVGERAG
jgi:hypothetical protein